MNAPRKVSVLFDVSPITARPEERTGLARVALSLGLALAARDDVTIRSCAWGSLHATKDFEVVRDEFPALRGLIPGSTSWERLCTNELRKAAAAGGIQRRAWTLAGQITNRLRNPLAGVDLRRFDCVHSTYARIPRVVRRHRLPVILTLHDILPLRLASESLPPGQVGITRRILKGIRRTDWVACVSEWTRREFLDVCDHPPERTVVISNGVDHTLFHENTDREQVETVRARFGVQDRPYFLTLSSLAPHKNLQFLLEAWNRSGVSAQGAALVLAGGRTTNPHAALAALGVEEATPGIVATGFISDDEFRALATGAQAFLFPSLYEGFGLPALEAMACGAPVIASNRTAIPEVVGTAGELLDPTDREAWAHAFTAALGPARHGPHAASLRQASRFAWAATAEHYSDLYRRVVA